MDKLITTVYIDLEPFVKDLIRFEEHINVWLKRYPDYKADVVAEIDDGEFYSITILCKRP